MDVSNAAVPDGAANVANDGLLMVEGKMDVVALMVFERRFPGSCEQESEEEGDTTAFNVDGVGRRPSAVVVPFE